MAGVSTTDPGNGSALTRRQQHDPVQWMRFYWERQTGDDPSGFLAMTSLLRLHHLMTSTLEHQLRAECAISLTDYQILKALQLSETGTWLLSRMAWHLMVHATTVTLAVERLEAKHLVDRRPHPHDRRATLLTITGEGRTLTDRATEAIGRTEFGLPGLTPAQARAMVTTLARLRAQAGDIDRAYGTSPGELG